MRRLFSPTRKRVAGVAGAVLLAAGLAACSSSGAPAPSGTPAPASSSAAPSTPSRSASSGVIQLTPANFNQILSKNSNTPIYILYTSDNCAQCATLQTLEENAVPTFKGRVLFVELNLSQYPQLADGEVTASQTPVSAFYDPVTGALAGMTGVPTSQALFNATITALLNVYPPRQSTVT